MRNWLSLVMVLLISVMLFGCARNDADTLTYVAQEDEIANRKSLSFEVNLGHKVSNATVTTEYWQAGKLVDQVPVALDSTTTELNTVFDMDFFVGDLADSCVDVQVRVDSANTEKHEILMRQFELPESACAYTFECYEDKEKIAVAPGVAFILGGIAFDIGDGVEDIDKKGLIEDSNRFNDYDCIIIVRAQFE